MNFNLFTLYAILRQAVIDMAYNPGLSVNSFMVVDERADPMQDSYGATYEDFLSGYFWARKWTLEGASPQAVKGEFPVLFVEEMETTAKQADKDETTATISLILLDKIQCEICPPGIRRTPLTVRENLKTMARAVIQEAARYRLYEKGAELVWASPGRAATWPGGEPNWTEEVDGYIDTRNIQYRKWGNFAGMRGVLVQIKVSSCTSVSLPYDYETEPSPLLGAVNCGC